MFEEESSPTGATEVLGLQRRLDGVPKSVQVYGGHDTSTVVRPHRRLVGFARVEVPPGQVATVDVALDLDQLRIRSEGSWRVESGVQQLDVGLHANDPHRVDLEPDLTIIDGRVRPVSTRR